MVRLLAEDCVFLLSTTFFTQSLINRNRRGFSQRVQLPGHQAGHSFI